MVLVMLMVMAVVRGCKNGTEEIVNKSKRTDKDDDEVRKSGGGRGGDDNGDGNDDDNSVDGIRHGRTKMVSRMKRMRTMIITMMPFTVMVMIMIMMI